jgi:hypothetical protein
VSHKFQAVAKDDKGAIYRRAKIRDQLAKEEL